jgi:hypothetical protein
MAEQKMTEQQLLDLKSKIEAAKGTVSELKGQKQALMKQLLDDWQCETTEAAEKKLKEMDDSIAEIDLKIEKGSKELQKAITVEI